MSTSFVKTWLWVDKDEILINQYQILLPEYWAGVVTNAIAVLITSTLGPVFELLREPFWLVWQRLTSRWNLARPNAVKKANDFYEMSGEAARSIAQELQERWVEYQLHLGPPVHTRRGAAIEAFGAAAMSAIALGLPVALLIASIISAGLATTTIALSQAPQCGTYVYPRGTKNSSTFVEFEHRVEAEAGLYADECYGDSSLVENCNKFYNQTISYSVTNATQCPFDGEVCQKVNDSITFTTGLVPASVLGVNTATSLLFSKTMICSPLDNSPKYVSIDVSDRGEEQWEYWYGRSGSLDGYTWANPVKESSWEIKGYSTGIHCSEPGAGDATFLPLPEFMAGYYPVTISFISSHAIFYPQFRDDPIFPARQKARFPVKDGSLTLYYNNSTRAGVLGCVDRFQICRTTDGPCWDNGNATLIFDEQDGSKVTQEQNVALLLLLALDWSTACGSTQFRGAEALDAQAKIAHMRSLPLAEKQWQVESEKMFQTSLARMQLNVFNVVRGTASSFEGYKDILDARYRGICKLVKIPTIGWRNINFAGVIGVLFSVIFLWIISRKVEDSAGNKRLIIVLCWEKFLRGLCIEIGKGCGKVLRLIVAGAVLVWTRVVVPFIFEPARTCLMSWV